MKLKAFLRIIQKCKANLAKPFANAILKLYFMFAITYTNKCSEEVILVNNIKQLAKSKKISLTTIVKKAPVSNTHLHSIIGEHKKPSLIIAKNIARVLGVPLAEVFPDDDDCEKCGT